MQDWIIRPQLRTTPGLADVDSLGGYIKEFVVEPDAARLASLGISYGELSQALEDAKITRKVALRVPNHLGLAPIVSHTDHICTLSRRAAAVFANTGLVVAFPVPFKVAHYAFAVTRTKPGDLQAAYWALAKADGGWRVELAFADAVDDWCQWCRDTFAIPEGIDPLGYADRQSGEVRLAFFDGPDLLAAFFLAREPVAVARNWAIAQLNAGHTDLRKRFALVAGRPGADKPDPGATVCACFGVGVNQIVAAVRAGCHSVEAVGKQLNAGTNCGSCRAEIRGIVDGCLAAAAE